MAGGVSGGIAGGVAGRVTVGVLFESVMAVTCPQSCGLSPSGRGSSFPGRMPLLSRRASESGRLLCPPADSYKTGAGAVFDTGYATCGQEAAYAL